jgi:metal-dependent hydrolase (beta-lactamase superfamily II)
VRQVQAMTGIDKVHAVVGGWHLAPAPDATVAKTVDALKQINPDYLIPMHCTGFNMISVSPCYYTSFDSAWTRPGRGCDGGG